MTYRILRGDVLSFARHYHGPLFHALLCDSPYNLESISKRFKNPSQKDYEVAKSNPHRRTSGGFMNARWDSDIAFHSETWEAFSTLLYPGAFMMVFGGSRTSHRLACAIEDAGFVLHPTVYLWNFGSGFPKATRIDSQIDRKYGTLENDSFQDVRAWIRDKVKERGLKYKDIDRALGNENSHKASHYLDNSQPQLPTPEDWVVLKGLIGINDDIDMPRFLKYETDIRQKVGEQTKARKVGQGIPLPNGGDTEYQTWDLTEPTTNIARAWISHRYGLQALKPAVEPIIVAQKPYSGRPIDNITTTGAGALNIDAGRISIESGDNIHTKNPHTLGTIGENGIYGIGIPTLYNVPRGRWPANFVLQHSPACRRVGTKNVKSGIAVRKNGAGGGMLCARLSPSEDAGYADIDGNETIAEWECVPECAVRRLGEQSGELKSGRPAGVKRAENNVYGKYKTGIPITGYGDAGFASRFFFNSSWEYEQEEPEWNIEVEERLLESDPVRYEAKASTVERNAGLNTEPRITNDGREKSIDNPYLRGETLRRNSHPTVKPTSLTRHLASLLLPPDRYSPRRIFVPFCGVGSEMAGALLAGWDEIIGVEGEADYAKIGRARLSWWEQRMKETGLTEPKAILKAKNKSTTRKNGRKKNNEPSLF